jgi:hypothetical protein
MDALHICCGMVFFQSQNNSMLRTPDGIQIFFTFFVPPLYDHSYNLTL